LWQICKYIIENSRELKIPDKINWYLSLSANSNSYVRWSVLESLPSVINVYPEKSSEIFFIIVSYKEVSDKRELASEYGTLRIYSTAKQDNQMVIYVAAQIFQSLLESNPGLMIESVIKIIESKYIRTKNLEDDVVEDYSNIWYHGFDSTSNDHELNILSTVDAFVCNCALSKFQIITPSLSSSRFAIFHKFFLGRMLKDALMFKQEILLELSKKWIFRIESLEGIVYLVLKH
jgi:hypothetical protein